MIPAGALSWDLVFVVTLVCLLASGFFSGLETGLMSVSRIRLRSLSSDRDDRRPRRLAVLLDRLEAPVLDCLIGTNLFNVFGSAVLTVAFTARYPRHGELWAAMVGSLLVITFAEILPKVLYREYPERLTLASLSIFSTARLIFRPLGWLLIGYSRLLDALLPGRGADDRTALGRDAMTALLTTHPTAVRDRRFAELLDRCLDLADLDQTALMRPWPEVRMLPRTATLAEARAVAAETGFSRLPVQEPADGRVLGWVLVRDLLLVDEDAPWDGLPSTLVRTFAYVDRSMSPWAVFEEMRWQRQQMAVVVDGPGNPVGLVTLEDLLEILVGSIEDEFDRSLTTPEPSAPAANA